MKQPLEPTHLRLKWKVYLMPLPGPAAAPTAQHVPAVPSCHLSAPRRSRSISLPPPYTLSERFLPMLFLASLHFEHAHFP